MRGSWGNERKDGWTKGDGLNGRETYCCEVSLSLWLEPAFRVCKGSLEWELAVVRVSEELASASRVVGKNKLGSLSCW